MVMKLFNKDSNVCFIYRVFNYYLIQWYAWLIYVAGRKKSHKNKDEELHVNKSTLMNSLFETSYCKLQF